MMDEPDFVYPAPAIVRDRLIGSPIFTCWCGTKGEYRKIRMDDGTKCVELWCPKHFVVYTHIGDVP